MRVWCAGNSDLFSRKWYTRASRASTRARGSEPPSRRGRRRRAQADDDRVKPIVVRRALLDARVASRPMPLGRADCADHTRPGRGGCDAQPLRSPEPHWPPARPIGIVLRGSTVMRKRDVGRRLLVGLTVPILLPAAESRDSKAPAGSPAAAPTPGRDPAHQAPCPPLMFPCHHPARRRPVLVAGGFDTSADLYDRAPAASARPAR